MKISFLMQRLILLFAAAAQQKQQQDSDNQQRGPKHRLGGIAGDRHSGLYGQLGLIRYNMAAQAVAYRTANPCAIVLLGYGRQRYLRPRPRWEKAALRFK